MHPGVFGPLGAPWIFQAEGRASSAACPPSPAGPATCRARFLPARAWARRSPQGPCSRCRARPGFCTRGRQLEPAGGGRFSAPLGSRGQRGLGAPAQGPRPSRGGRGGRPPGVGGSLGAAALCSPHPRRRCLSNLAALAGGACVLWLGGLSLFQYAGVGLRSLGRREGREAEVQRTGSENLQH